VQGSKLTGQRLSRPHPTPCKNRGGTIVHIPGKKGTMDLMLKGTGWKGTSTIGNLSVLNIKKQYFWPISKLKLVITMFA